MRVVQDSDDELDDDLEAVLPPRQPNAADQPSNDTTHTGSTESLKRAIEEAHRAHLQSQPSQKEPQSSVSLPEHPIKRRKTSADVTSRKSPDAGFANKRVPVTYGKRSKTVFSSPPTYAGPVEEPAGNHAVESNPAPSDEAGWNLQGTMRDNYARHEPMAMFPEPSSTIPNATMTQQRVLEAVNAPAMLGQGFEDAKPRYITSPEPSVPWSDLMKFTPVEASEQTQSSNREQPASDLPSATPPRTTQQDRELRTSQRSSPLRNKVVHAGVDPKENTAPPLGACLTAVSELPSTASPKSHRDSQEDVRKSPLRRKSQGITNSNSDDDLAGDRILKEQYKPRPSRSRSLKVITEEPIDYSVRPEKAKRVSKRRKTTAAVSDTIAVTTPQKVQQICDMGFTPSTTTNALKRNNGDVTQTVEWLVLNNIGHDELAPHSPLKTKPAPKGRNEIPTMDLETMQDIMRNLNEYRRGEPETPQNAIASTVANGAVVPPEPANDATKSLKTEMPSDAAPVRSPTKVQVIIPKKSPKNDQSQVPNFTAGLSKKAKRRKTTLDQPEPEPIIATSVMPEVVTEKKKGRSRPKKAAPTVTPNEPAHETLAHSAYEEYQDKVLQTIEPNLASGKSDAEHIGSIHIPDDVQLHEPEDPPTSKPPSKTSPAANPISQTPEQSTKKPVSHSPINKGKVPYRVGLSKRARIAPLLRTLKK
ncbi:hypothetical protein EJ02DRAFT_413784 [Clathrospora elynae]|uniref:UBA domain-containing protein n=1 Tax=Clathrospora elynae TaxID=706981 RepID=A0A6A5S7G7_9PLEO|nr:hypothetical protein EJ02DRAFT_413784 [Clathrospora elynae]